MKLFHRFQPNTMMRIGPARLLASKLFIALTIGASTVCGAGEPIQSRGKALYEVSCIQCHDRSVHQRKELVARNLDEIRATVKRWSATAAPQWSAEDILAVTIYLNARYYHYPCETPDCRFELTLR